MWLLLRTVPCSRGRPPGTARRSRRSWDRAKGRCSVIVIACSARARTPRTPPRTLWNAPGGSWRPMTAQGPLVPGSSASRPMSVLTGCGPAGAGSAWSATGRPRRPARVPARLTPSSPGLSRSATLTCACRPTRRMKWSDARRSAWPSWPLCNSWRPVSAPRCSCMTCWDSPTPRSPRCSRSARPRSTACCRGPANLLGPRPAAAARYHRPKGAAAPRAVRTGVAACRH